MCKKDVPCARFELISNIYTNNIVIEIKYWRDSTN